MSGVVRKLFFVESKGNDETVVFNDSHPWMKELRRLVAKLGTGSKAQLSNEAVELECHLADLFSAHVRALYFCAGFVEDVDDFADTINANWGLAVRVK